MRNDKVNLFLIGAQKCGTTLLSDLLGSHKEIFVPSIKETYFFCDNRLYDKGVDWLHREFYSSRAARRAAYRVDATPFYLASPEATDRIAAYSDEHTRYLIILRDPVARAVSAYLHQVRLGYESLPLEDALAAEPDRIAASRSEGGRWWRHAYTEISMYGKHISHAMKVLDKNRLLILWQDELKDISNVREKVSDFICVDNTFSMKQSTHINSASMPKSITLRNLTTRENLLKSILRKLIPRETRTRIGRNIIKFNSRSVDKPPLSKETEYSLNDLFRDDQALLDSLGYGPRKMKVRP